jgi:tetratricopeptide (TPR) repeat protein
MQSLKIGKLFSSKDTFLLISGILLFIGAGLIHQRFKKPVLKIPKQDSAININTDLLVFMSAGNKRLLADLFWIQTLLESDLEHYSKSDLKSWMFIRFKTISILDPLFYQNYSWGGQYLSIVKDDMAGGIELMESGLKYFPDDYKLHYLLGFSYYYELNNYEKGIYYFEKILDRPQAPPYLKTVVNKMKVERGFNIESALDLIQFQIAEATDEGLKRKLKNDFYALKAEKDLKCLNTKGQNCDFKNADGDPYILRNGLYYSPKPFLPYRLMKKGQYKKAEEINTIK